MSGREWWGIGAAAVCYAVSLAVYSAGGPYVVGEDLGRTILVRVPAVATLVWPSFY